MAFTGAFIKKRILPKKAGKFWLLGFYPWYGY
jgi:hypothetical protein